jgi:rubrerythrin
MEWHVDSQKLTEIYERSKLQCWNPSDLPWDDLDPEAFTPEQRIGMMYWFAVLANFDASGPPVFAQAMVHAYEHHEEDPVRKCFFSITRDEMNHEECCQRTIAKLWPGGPLGWEPRTDLEKAAHNNIGWLYHNGGRYWNGYSSAVGKYSLPVLFTSFMMGEMAASTLFRGMSSGTTHPVFQEMFQRIGRDESRHLQICMTILENEWPGLTDEVKVQITRQLRAGFVFLSMILWEPPEGFWDIPPYFLGNHRVLMNHARDGGLGVLSYEEQAENWRLAIARIRAIVERWGIEFPAIPELDISGIEVNVIDPEDIIPVF